MRTGEIIRDIREQKGLSRDEVIRRNRFWSYQAWGRMERSDRRLSVEEVKEVAIALDMEAVELFLLLIDTKKQSP